MSRHRVLVLVPLIALVVAGARLTSTVSSSAPAAAPVMEAMRLELARSLETLRKQPTPPYYLSYEITEVSSASVEGEFGTVTSSGENKRRVLGLDIRVGTPAFDNTHQLGGFEGGMAFFSRFNLAAVPIDDSVRDVRRVLWRETDRAYKAAAEQFARAKTSAQLHVTPEDTSPDFSHEAVAERIEQPLVMQVDRAAWERKIRAYTAPFAREKDIYEGHAELTAEGETRWYVNSDKSELQTSSVYYRLLISAYTRADDGMLLPRYESFLALTPAGLPDDSTVVRAVRRLIDDLHALKKAPVISAMTTPAILSGRASGVFFHEILGHRVEGHRQRDEEDAQTFKGKIGQRVLPRDFSVWFDPNQERLGNVELAGHYAFDNEGVAGQRVSVVSNGVFRGFLMSRTPIAGFKRSNGHGRRQPGYPAVARQSNLFVSSARPVPPDSLERLLIAEVKRQRKPYGLIFDDIEGGFTFTSRFEPNAFQVMPIMVRRVFPDGRKELVRGANLIGTPLTTFGRIVAADNRIETFNGVCGAESGAVPVSASSPAVLISQIEIQRKEKEQEQGPILPPPGVQP